MIQGYIYKITVKNPKSVLNGYSYVGKHKLKMTFPNKSIALNDGYFGSGKILREYYKEWGTGYKVDKDILEFIYFFEDIDSKESKHIRKDKKKFIFFENKKNLNIRS